MYTILQLTAQLWGNTNFLQRWDWLSWVFFSFLLGILASEIKQTNKTANQHRNCKPESEKLLRCHVELQWIFTSEPMGTNKLNLFRDIRVYKYSTLLAMVITTHNVKNQSLSLEHRRIQGTWRKSVKRCAGDLCHRNQRQQGRSWWGS